MFRIVCDPSSGSIKLYLTEIRSGSLMFVVCLVGVWQRNFEPVVCVYTVRRVAARRTALATQEKLAYLGFQCLHHPPILRIWPRRTTICSLD